MAITQRSDSGRARSRYDRLELYDVVRDVALAAVEQALEHGEKLDPLLLREKDWGAARRFSGYPDAPSARQICQRLKDQKGNPFPWRELLELVFNPEADIQQVEVARTRRPRLEKVAPDAVWYSLRRVAGDRETLTLDEYTLGFEQLIAADRRRRDAGAGALEDALLTPGQILNECGSWPDALRRGGLEVRDEHYTAGRVSLKEGALRFVQEVGALPTTKLLRFFARQQGFALEDVDNSKSWATHISEFSAYIVEQGQPAPPPYVPAETTAAWNRWIEQQASAVVTSSAGAHEDDDEPAGGLAPESGGDGSAAAEVELALAPTDDDAAAIAGPADDRNDGADRQPCANGNSGAAVRAYQPKRFWKKKSEIIEQLRAFLDWELPNAEAKRTTALYTRWSREEPGRPSLDSVQKFGPLDQLLKEARKPDAVDKARAEEELAEQKAPAVSIERLQRKHVESRKGQQLLILLRDRGEMTRLELENELGWPQRTVSTYLKWLEQAGAVNKLGETNRRATYSCARSESKVV